MVRAGDQEGQQRTPDCKEHLLRAFIGPKGILFFSGQVDSAAVLNTAA